MSKKPFLKIKCSENRVEKVRQLARIFCVLDFQDVTARELDLLCEYIYHNGDEDKALKSFKLNYSTTKENYGQVSRRLYDKGILVDKVRTPLNNKHKVGIELHPSFLKLKEFYIDDEEPNVLAIIIP